MKLKTRVRHFLYSMSTLGVILLCTILVRGACQTSKQLDPAPPSAFEPRAEFAERLGQSIRFETISNVDPSRMNLEAWDGLSQFLETSYPNVHSNLVREVIGPCSWVYTWRASGPQKPILLIAHTDVVPVEASKASGWTHPPFSGRVDDTFIWGRGSLDNKASVLGILEAAEVLLEQGKQPSRTVVFGFGCDEEVGGHQGARQMVEHFKKNGVSFEWVLDEGHIIGDGFFPGLDRPVAFIGLAEKGYVTLELKVEGQGGHSSMPSSQTAVGVLSAAIAQLEANPFPSRLSPPIQGMLEHLGPEVSGPLKFVFANLWALEVVVLNVFAGKPSTNATVRTTTAATVFRGGVRENVLPKTAEAQVNFRILPGETIKSVRDRVEEIIDDSRVKITIPERGFKSDPSPVSAIDSDGYRAIAQSIRNVFAGGIYVAPSLTVGGTDSRHFADVTENTYRFLPLTLTPTDTPRIHGVDERVAIADYEQAIRFYAELLNQNMAR